MRLSASIMAHPDRSALVTDLQGRLDRDVPVYWDPEGKPSGNADRGWRVAAGAWALRDPGADWHLLLQDDALPCLDLLAGLERALEGVPDDAIVMPYLGQGGAHGARWARVGQAADQTGARWIITDRVHWGVAIAVPTWLVPELIERANRMTGTTDDMRVSGWAKSRHADVWYTWPSLVDHRPVPSITKHRAADRRAVRHHEASALTIDWRGPIYQDPAYARIRGPRSGPRGNWKVTSPQRRAAPGR